MQGDNINESTVIDHDKKTEKRHKRVRHIKATIVVTVIFFLLLPTLICILLQVQVVQLQRQVAELTSAQQSAAQLTAEDTNHHTYVPITKLPAMNNNHDLMIGQLGAVYTNPTYGKVDAKLSGNHGEMGTNEYERNTTENSTNQVNSNANNMEVDITSTQSQYQIKEDQDMLLDLNQDPTTDKQLEPSDDQENIRHDQRENTDETITISKKAVNTKTNQINQENDNTTGTNSQDIRIESSSIEKYAGQKVYLTFDDGPSKYTDEILDILAEYDVKATFFVIGKTDQESKRLYQRIVDEGHTLGMHSYSHIYQNIYNSIEDFEKDFTKLWKLLYDTTGYMPTIYRFPGGSSNQVNKHGMNEFIRYLNKKSVLYYDWNVDNGDATKEKYTKEQLADNVLKGIGKRKTSIVLMHDVQTKKTTVDSLPMLLEELIAQGAQLLPLDESVPLIQQIKAEQIK